MDKLTKFLLVALLLTPFSSAVSVGVSPGYINQGEVEPGTTQEIDFYITTNSGDEFQVDPMYKFSTSYAAGQNTPISMENVSEQDITSWISWTQDTYTVDPNASATYTLPDDSSVSAEGVITMQVDIPPNAEPGYHIGDINLNPSISGSGGGAGAIVVAQTQPTFAFRVPGAVQRDVNVEGIEAVRIGETKVQLIAQLRNTGTVTTSMGSMLGAVYDQNNRNMGEVVFNGAKLRPGEYAEVDAIWRSDSLEGGEYRIQGTGDYTTGETYLSGEFVITDNINSRQSVEEPSGSVAEESEDVPLTLIIVASLLIGTLLYLLEVELTWIIMLIGGTVVTLYILLGAVSNVLVLIPLISIAIMLYV